MTNRYCEFSNWEGTRRCGAPAAKQVRVACPSGHLIWCCDEHYEEMASSPYFPEGVVEF